MIDINKITENIIKLKSKFNTLNVDSIYIQQNDKLDVLVYDKENQLHELRSCSKLIVAMAIMMIIKEGKLSLETKVYDCLNKLVEIKDTENIEKIKKWTIHNLLTHMTGYDKQMMSTEIINSIPKKKLLNYVLNYKLVNEVGNTFVYNNAEPYIISVFLKEALNIDLGQYIEENIFKKLNISEYKLDYYDKYFSACTGMYLKHEDFHKIATVILNSGRYFDNQIIDKKYLDKIFNTYYEIKSGYTVDKVFPKIGVGYYTYISKKGIIFRDGSNGQYIIIDRNNDTVITVLSSESTMNNITEIFRDII